MVLTIIESAIGAIWGVILGVVGVEWLIARYDRRQRRNSK